MEVVNSVLFIAKLNFKDFCDKNLLDEHHGYSHGIRVLNLATQTLQQPQFKPFLTYKQALQVSLAALLHDVDDPKIFPNSVNFGNARALLKKTFGKDKLHDNVKPILFMIERVSTSKNGDEANGAEKWQLIPRYCDRLDALGGTGIIRAYQFSMYKGHSLFLESTPICTTNEELQDLKLPERYAAYSKGGKSFSMIDHYYDKLLNMWSTPFGCPFLDDLAEERTVYMLHWIYNVNKARLLGQGESEIHTSVACLENSEWMK